MAIIQKDWIPIYFEQGIDKSNRRIFLTSDMEDKTISNIVKGIYYLDSLDDKKPIELFVGSLGGSVYSMLGIYDILRTTKCPIFTISLDVCMSAAPLLIAAGKKGERYSMLHTQWMIHNFSDQLEEKRIDELEIDIKHTNSLFNIWTNLMEKHTKLSAKQWKTMCRKPGDRYFDADKAIEYGLVDHIWSEKD